MSSGFWKSCHEVLLGSGKSEPCGEEGLQSGSIGQGWGHLSELSLGLPIVLRTREKDALATPAMGPTYDQSAGNPSLSHR